MTSEPPDLWKEIAKWALGLWAAAMLGVIVWMNSRVGNIQDQLGTLTVRVTRIETLTDGFSKQLDAIQPQRIADATKIFFRAARNAGIHPGTGV